MKMPGLVVLERHPHVDVIACREVEVPLAHAVQEGLYPWLPEESGSRRRRRQRRSRQDVLQPAPQPRLHLRAQGALPARDEAGCLAHGPRTALIDFLLDRWDPGAPDFLGDVLRALPEQRSERRIAVERALEQLESTKAPPGRRVRLVTRSDLDLDSWSYSRIYDAAVETYLSTSGFMLTVACPREVTVAGRQFTRHEILALAGPDVPVLHHDGHRLRRWTSLHQVPAAVLHRFDAHGTAVVDGEEARLPLHDLVPSFLLEVPGGCSSPASTAPRWPQPAWMVPASRVPSLEDHSELPCLTGTAAEEVLARTTSGVYLPGNAPFEAGERLGPPGSLWVGARPRCP